jgi:putative transposase
MRSIGQGGLEDLGRTDESHLWLVLDAAFLEYGLPKALRSDNGSPFASTAAGGL